MNFKSLSFALACVVAIHNTAVCQNPIIQDQFTADPTARVFNDTVWLYPSHDIPVVEGHGKPGWFCMEDYHVFSSANLSDWTDHGVIVSQESVPWADPHSYSMWAPDCIKNNGKYYFYFPTNIDSTLGKGFAIGVAVSDHPGGPFVIHPEPIKNVHGIDPNVFIDKDGKVYLYWAMGNIFAARLKKNMIELDSEPLIVRELPDKGLKEGPFVFERNGIYYMTYPHVQNNIERLEYATGNNPSGPFKFAGVIMDESPSGCWTNHQSIVKFHDQWYLFYHHNDLSPDFDKNRSVRIDRLYFNDDGTIQKVIPTLRGVGYTDASRKIQIDRYNYLSKGTSVAFADTLNTFKGWITQFNEKGAWIQYNDVNFENNPYKTVQVLACSEKGNILQIRLDNAGGQLIAEVNVPAGFEWKIFKAPVIYNTEGLHNLIIVSAGNEAKVDWIQFSH